MFLAGYRTKFLTRYFAHSNTKDWLCPHDSNGKGKYTNISICFILLCNYEIFFMYIYIYIYIYMNNIYIYMNNIYIYEQYIYMNNIVINFFRHKMLY